MLRMDWLQSIVSMFDHESPLECRRPPKADGIWMMAKWQRTNIEAQKETGSACAT
jgi:hypothetical protein